jgi:L-lactate dehydrogenase
MVEQIISIIGIGNVGKTLASIIASDTTIKSVINLIVNRTESLGGMIDLCQLAELYQNCTMTVNNEKLLLQSDFIFHCAGVSVPQGSSRRETAQENIKICKDIFENRSFKPSTKIIVLANPLDVITYYSWKYSGLNKTNVIGTGTLLESIRLNYYYNLKTPGNYQTLVCGEHGESAVYIKSQSFVNQKWIGAEANSDQEATVLKQMYKSASTIKKTQGATYYAVSACAHQIMLAILSDSNTILPVCVVTNKQSESLLDSKPLAISLPHLINKEGAKWHNQLSFKENEIDLLRQSAKEIEQMIYQTK